MLLVFLLVIDVADLSKKKKKKHLPYGVLFVITNNAFGFLQDETLRNAVAAFKGKSWKKIGFSLSSVVPMILIVKSVLL